MSTMDMNDIRCIAECTLNELSGLARDRDEWRKQIMITTSRTRLDGTR